MLNIHPDLFLISDTHFGHRRLTDWGRPENFNEMIIERWNNVVTKKDNVLHLGDLTMVNKEETEKYVKGLKGNKYLILGNHDDKSITWYAEMGFTVINPIFFNWHTKHDMWIKLLFTHIPEHHLPPNWFNIHGHMHGNTHRGHVDAKNHLDMSVDCWFYTPIRLHYILGDIFREVSQTD